MTAGRPKETSLDFSSRGALVMEDHVTMMGNAVQPGVTMQANALAHGPTMSQVVVTVRKCSMTAGRPKETSLDFSSRGALVMEDHVTMMGNAVQPGVTMQANALAHGPTMSQVVFTVRKCSMTVARSLIADHDSDVLFHFQ